MFHIASQYRASGSLTSGRGIIEIEHISILTSVRNFGRAQQCKAKIFKKLPNRPSGYPQSYTILQWFLLHVRTSVNVLHHKVNPSISRAGSVWTDQEVKHFKKRCIPHLSVRLSPGRAKDKGVQPLPDRQGWIQAGNWGDRPPKTY